MKKLRVLLASAIMMLSVGVVSAQKIAHLNYEEVLSLMPETKKATDDLDKFSKTKDAELKKLSDAWSADVQKFEAEAAKMTDAQRQAKGQELQKTQQNLQQMLNTAQQDIQKRRETLLQPIINKLNAAIEKAAKANAYELSLIHI